MDFTVQHTHLSSNLAGEWWVLDPGSGLWVCRVKRSRAKISWRRGVGGSYFIKPTSTPLSDQSPKDKEISGRRFMLSSIIIRSYFGFKLPNFVQHNPISITKTRLCTTNSLVQREKVFFTVLNSAMARTTNRSTLLLKSPLSDSIEWFWQQLKLVALKLTQIRKIFN